MAQACPRDQAVEAAQAFTGNRGFDAVLICADTASNDPVELAAWSTVANLLLNLDETLTKG